MRFLNWGYLPETKINFGRYVGGEYGAFYLSFVERVDAGDVIDVSSLRVVKTRSQCFPNSEAPQPFPVNSVSKDYERNLSGDFQAEVGAALGADITILDTDIAKFSSAQTKTFIAKEAYSDECSWLSNRASLPETNNLLAVRTLLSLQGNFRHKAEVSVSGQLSVDVADKLRSFVSERFKDLLPDFDVVGSIDGSFREVDENSLGFPQLTPVGIYPEFVSAGIVSQYLEIFGEQKMEEWLARAEGTQETAQAFLENNPRFVYEQGQLPRLFAGEDLEPFSREREDQVAALQLENRIVLLNHEARLLGASQ
ncbi:MAG: hypothetical protein AAGA38_13405 [Pseudomonadota bacterium]